jgi:hypothetical protein
MTIARSRTPDEYDIGEPDIGHRDIRSAGVIGAGGLGRRRLVIDSRSPLARLRLLTGGDPES